MHPTEWNTVLTQNVRESQILLRWDNTITLHYTPFPLLSALQKIPIMTMIINPWCVPKTH